MASHMLIGSRSQKCTVRARLIRCPLLLPLRNGDAASAATSRDHRPAAGLRRGVTFAITGPSPLPVPQRSGISSLLRCPCKWCSRLSVSICRAKHFPDLVLATPARCGTDCRLRRTSLNMCLEHSRIHGAVFGNVCKAICMSKTRFNRVGTLSSLRARVASGTASVLSETRDRLHRDTGCATGRWLRWRPLSLVLRRGPPKNVCRSSTANLSYLYQNLNDGTGKQARDSEDESQAKTDEGIDAAWVQLDTMYRQWDDRRAVLTSDELFIRRRAVGSLAKEVKLCSGRHARSLLVPLSSRLWPWRRPGNGVPEHNGFFLTSGGFSLS